MSAEGATRVTFLLAAILSEWAAGDKKRTQNDRPRAGCGFSVCFRGGRGGRLFLPYVSCLREKPIRLRMGRAGVIIDRSQLDCFYPLKRDKTPVGGVGEVLQKAEGKEEELLSIVNAWLLKKSMGSALGAFVLGAIQVLKPQTSSKKPRRVRPLCPGWGFLSPSSSPSGLAFLAGSRIPSSGVLQRGKSKT